MISTFASSDKHWWQLGLLVFSPKAVLEVIAAAQAARTALLQACATRGSSSGEIPAARPMDRDLEPGLGSGGSWAAHRGVTSHLVLTSCSKPFLLTCSSLLSAGSALL